MPDGITSEVSIGTQLRELLVFLFVILPSMIISLFGVRQGTLGFTLTAYAIIFRDLGLVALIIYFLWRNREPVGSIGWRRTRPWTEIFIGILLYPVMAVTADILEIFFRSAGLQSPSTKLPSFLEVTRWSQFALAFVMIVVVALAEETIFRGYIILRLHSLFRGRTEFAAIILSSIIFAFGHGYEGTLGMATVGYMGLVFALVYIWRQNLIAPIVMHFLQDFISILVVPLLASHK